MSKINANTLTFIQMGRRTYSGIGRKQLYQHIRLSFLFKFHKSCVICTFQLERDQLDVS